jgi:hypothetical protein
VNSRGFCPDYLNAAMKIIEQTDQFLHITDQNHKFRWGLLFATPFLLIGLVSLATVVKVIKLECQRTPGQQVTCQRNITGLLGTAKDQIPGDIQTATVVKNSGIGVVLETTTGKSELAPYRTLVTSRHNRTVDRLNSFLQNPQQATVQVEQDDRLINLLWSGNFLLGGLGAALLALAIPMQMSCRFDRSQNQVVLNKKYWLYGDRQQQLALSDIQEAQVRSLSLALSINRQSMYGLELVTKTDQKISFSVPSSNLSHYQEVAYAINQFLPHHDEHRSV